MLVCPADQQPSCWVHPHTPFFRDLRWMLKVVGVTYFFIHSHDGERRAFLFTLKDKKEFSQRPLKNLTTEVVT